MILSRGINFGTDVLSSCNLEIKLHSHVWELRSLNLCKDRIDRKEFCFANLLSLSPQPSPLLSLMRVWPAILTAGLPCTQRNRG